MTEFYALKNKQPKLSIGFGTGITNVQELNNSENKKIIENGEINLLKIKRMDEDRLDQYTKRLAPREGGIADRGPEADQGGVTNKGVSTPTLNLLREKNKNLPQKTPDLSDKQIKQIYREEYYYRPQINKLARVLGLEESGSKLAEHVFDSAVLHGDIDAGKWLQQSIDESIGSDLKEKGQYDGVMGSKTRAKLEEAIKAGKLQEIERAFVKKRRAHFRGLDNYKNNPGWENRTNDFEKSIKNIRD